MKQFLVVLALVAISKQACGALQICDHNEPGKFAANPDNCSEFFMCRSGRPVLFSCPANMYFDVVSGTCGYQARCASGDASSQNDDEGLEDGVFGPEFSPIEAGPSHLLLRSTVCERAPIGTILADTTGCLLFFQCTRAGVLRFECPAGTLFDSNRLVCEAADLASCAFEPNGGAPSAGNLLNVLCFGQKAGAKYAHPTNCTQYFLCNGRNAAQLFTCPRGTAYHRERKVCDFTHNVIC